MAHGDPHEGAVRRQPLDDRAADEARAAEHRDAPRRHSRPGEAALAATDARTRMGAEGTLAMMICI